MLMTKTHKEMQTFGTILMLSAWGFAIVIASFFFLYVGYHLDRLLGTSPNFMFGLFFLAIFMTIGRLYREAWLKRKEV
jgi:hypothetical protein